jgi:hypothetical protein
MLEFNSLGQMEHEKEAAEKKGRFAGRIPVGIL